MWVGVSAFFAIAAIAKITRGGLAQSLADTAMFPQFLIAPTAAGVIALELLVAILLLWPKCRRAGWYLVAGMSSAFAVIHVAGMLLGGIKSCRCLVVQLSQDARLNHLIMTAVCLALVALAIRAIRPRRPHLLQHPVPQGGLT